MIINNSKKLNPLICCVGEFGGNPADVGSGFSGFGQQSGFGAGGGPGGGAQAGSMRAALDEISEIDRQNNPANDQGVSYAENLSAKAKDIQKRTGLSYAKALGSIALGLATVGPVSVIKGIMDLTNVDEKTAKDIADTAKSLTEDHDISEERTDDIAEALGNLANSHAQATPQGDPDGNADADLERGILDVVISTNGTPGTSGSDLAGSIDTGVQDFVSRSDALTQDFDTRAQGLWDDYLNFENTYFGKFENILNEFDQNLTSIPSLSLQLPGSLGGANVPLAPKVHSAMFGNQAARKGDLTRTQANTQLAGLGSREALSRSMFNTGQIGLSNAFLPTQLAIDEQRMRLANELGINTLRTQADLNEPSLLESLAPVVGIGLSTPAGSNQTVFESVFDFGKNLFDSSFD